MNYHNFNHTSHNKFGVNYGPQPISSLLSLQTTKFFLEAYKKTSNKTIFNDKFQSSPLYSEESLIPESFTKLQEPFDRNEIFYIGNDNYNQRRGYNKYYYKPRKKNFYPKLPLKLNNSCELISTKNKKEKKIEDKNDIMMKKIENKVWILKLMDGENTVQYGPYCSEVLFMFLKNYYLPLNVEEQKKMNLLINDLVSDIYYQPESLFEFLKVELSKKQKEELGDIN